MSTDYKFNGWLGNGPDSAEGKMVWGEFEPKTWTEDDVDIKITHCGICGSDLHTLRSGWGATDYPCCVGHEIVGTAVRVGKNVKHIKLGDRVGVGAQSGSCESADCEYCSTGQENYCIRGHTGTYNSTYKNDGGKSYGGYSDYTRVTGRFAIPIPAGIPSELAAPMLCAGVTVYAPLKKNGCGPGKNVGIVGVGGLGHFGILFAKALGADKVVGISRKVEKKDDVLKLGADAYIATSDDKDWVKNNHRSLHIIISTVSSPGMPLNDYLSLLKPGGTFIQVGAPDGGYLPVMNAFTVILGGIKFGGSYIGSPSDIKEMLQLAVDKDIKPWVVTRPLTDANQAIVDMEEGKARYRYVLVNEKHVSA